MIPMRSFARLAAATALVAGAFFVVPGSPAGAVEPTTTIPPVATGSLVDNGDGTATLTYADLDTLSGRLLNLVFLPSGATCGAAPQDSFSATSLILSSQAVGFPASPMLISTATSVISFPEWPGSLPKLVTLPAGDYQSCLYLSADASGFALTSSARLTIAESAPEPEPEPVAPAYTG
jgi:hypothetical protein